MAKYQYRSVSRGRRLTPAEVAKYDKIRRQVEKEFPPAKSDPIKVAICKLRLLRESQGLRLRKTIEYRKLVC